MLSNLIQDTLRNISGGLGIRLRRLYYSRRLKSCGKGLKIDVGVHLENLKYISIGDDVWIDKNVIITGGPAGKEENKKLVANPFYKGEAGEIYIGNYSHIGINAVLQGHGGIRLGDCFTSSAGCKIYSLSNDPNKCKDGTVAGRGDIFYIQSPVSVGENVWLGLNVVVVGNHIGDNSFILPQSVVTKSVEAHSFAGGSPATKVKDRLK